MTRRFIVRPEAEADIDDAYRWYEERRGSLGNDFLSVVEEAFATIEQTPEAFRAVHKQIRRVLTRRFPFAVFYVVGPDHVSVIAVLYQASDPERWQSRV